MEWLENIDFTPLIQIIVTLIITLITYKILPFIKAKTGEENWILLTDWTKTFVEAAELLYKEMGGEEKKNYVIGELEKKMASLGIKVDADDILNAIESAVKEMNDKKTLSK